MGLFGSKKPAVQNQALSQVELEDGSVVEVSQVVDCIGDSCPRPQLMTRAALSKAQPGDAIEIQIDNPTSLEAIPPMLPRLDATHLGTIKKDRYWQVLVRRN